MFCVTSELLDFVLSFGTFFHYHSIIVVQQLINYLRGLLCDEVVISFSFALAYNQHFRPVQCMVWCASKHIYNRTILILQ